MHTIHNYTRCRVRRDFISKERKHEPRPEKYKHIQMSELPARQRPPRHAHATSLQHVDSLMLAAGRVATCWQVWYILPAA